MITDDYNCRKFVPLKFPDTELSDIEKQRLKNIESRDKKLVEYMKTCNTIKMKPNEKPAEFRARVDRATADFNFDD